MEIVLARAGGGWPEEEVLFALSNRIVRAAAKTLGLKKVPPSELSLLFADDDTVRALNVKWRGKDKPTNVLSFPSMALKPGDPLPATLGDIVLAFETASLEARRENKPLDNHVSHLVLHGFLHLLGYDHEDESEAEQMEELERHILETLAIPDPYAVIDGTS